MSRRRAYHTDVSCQLRCVSLFCRASPAAEVQAHPPCEAARRGFERGTAAGALQAVGSPQEFGQSPAAVVAPQPPSISGGRKRRRSLTTTALPGNTRQPAPTRGDRRCDRGVGTRRLRRVAARVASSPQSAMSATAFEHRPLKPMVRIHQTDARAVATSGGGGHQQSAFGAVRFDEGLGLGVGDDAAAGGKRFGFGDGRGRRLCATEKQEGARVKVVGPFASAEKIGAANE